MSGEIETREPQALALTDLTDQELAVIANREHQLACAAMLSAAEHAIRAGDALQAAREMVPAGEWISWLDQNFDGSYHAASRCIRLATYAADVRGSGAATLTDALAVISGNPRLDPGRSETHRMVIELREAGLSYRAIGRKLGISDSTVYGHLHGDQVNARNERNRKRRVAERRALEQRRREREIKQALALAGDALNRVYAAAERLQDDLAAAEREATGEARAALQEAGRHYRKMRDSVVAALGADYGRRAA